METVSTARPAALSAAVGEAGVFTWWALDNALPGVRTAPYWTLGGRHGASCARKN